jgi:hypothetical protein
MSANDQIAIDTIQLSLNGEVKLGESVAHDPFLANICSVLDLGYRKCTGEEPLNVLNKAYNTEFLAEVIKAMIPLGGTVRNRKIWSEEAVDFLSLPIPEQMDSGVKASKKIGLRRILLTWHSIRFYPKLFAQRNYVKGFDSCERF